MAVEHFTPEWLREYLSDRLAADVVVESFSQFPRGSSRETRFARYRVAGQSAPVEIALRSDFPAGSVDPTSLDQEYFIYERLGQTDVPAARALWWEADPRWTPRPFYVREKIDGDWLVPGYSNTAAENDAFRISVAKEHLSKLAIVHQVNWQSLGFDRYLSIPSDEANAAHNYIDTLYRQYQEIRQEPIPVILEAVEWLHDHAPVAPRLCLCKGTNGYGEEVFRDGKLVAFSDWEEVSIGDPAADFAFMQDFQFTLQRDGKLLWSPEMAIEFYQEVSGIQVTIEAVGYYQLIRAFRLLVLAHKASTALYADLPATIRQAWTGTEVLHLGKRILALASGLTVPLIGEDRFAQLNESVDM